MSNQMGTMQLKDGKAYIETDEGTKDFNLTFVISSIKSGINKSRQGYYSDKLFRYAKCLKDKGLDGIDEVLPKLKAIAHASDINRGFINQIHEWLSKLKMFRNIKTSTP